MSAFGTADVRARPRHVRFQGQSGLGEQTAISEEAILTLGNTGVTKIGVVERGKLQRDEALEDQKDCRSKLIECRVGQGVARNHEQEAQS